MKRKIALTSVLVLVLFVTVASVYLIRNLKLGSPVSKVYKVTKTMSPDEIKEAFPGITTNPNKKYQVVTTFRKTWKRFEKTKTEPTGSPEVYEVSN